MALVTNSAVIVHWPDIDKYIQEPMRGCFQTNTTINNELSLLYKANETRRFPHMSPNSFNVNKKLETIWRYEPNGQTRMDFSIIGPLFYDLGCDTRFYSTFRDYGLVRENTLQQAFTVLNSSKIITTNETLNAAYRVGFELAHSIITTLWRPNAYLMKQIDTYVEKHFKDNFVIGMQFRFHYLDWNDTLVFFECAKRIEQTVMNKTFKWFISSDDEDNIEKMRKMFPDKVITAQGQIAHTGRNLAGFDRALADIELLAQTDEIIITGGSTFGYFY
jgi:hypothetical protein